MAHVNQVPAWKVLNVPPDTYDWCLLIIGFSLFTVAVLKGYTYLDG